MFVVLGELLQLAYWLAHVNIQLSMSTAPVSNQLPDFCEFHPFIAITYVLHI